MESNYARYGRQIMLPEWGAEGQQKLSKARVLVIGAGGLGCPALLYLAAAGVGHFGIIDGDKVEESNLHRQVLFGVSDIGKWKANAAKSKLEQQYPGVEIEACIEYLHMGNAWDIIENYDLVIDGSDNFSTRYLVNDTCVLLGKPWIYGSVYRFEGQVAVFNFTHPTEGPTAHYRHFFPEPPLPQTVPTCNTAGVLGLLPGMIGTMQALEAIKVLVGFGELLINTIYCINTLNHQVFRLNRPVHSQDPGNMPLSREDLASGNYDFGCHPLSVVEIDYEEFQEKLNKKALSLIDVREPGEAPSAPFESVQNLPLSTLYQLERLPHFTPETVLFCQAGQRSKTAIQLIKNRLPEGIQLFSLKKGLTGWMDWKSRQLPGA